NHSLDPHFFYTHPATTYLYPLSLHDALPIYIFRHRLGDELGHFLEHFFDHETRRQNLLLLTDLQAFEGLIEFRRQRVEPHDVIRSEEHTSELQSPCNLVCRLLLEKKKYTKLT